MHQADYFFRNSTEYSSKSNTNSAPTSGSATPVTDGESTLFGSGSTRGSRSPRSSKDQSPSSEHDRVTIEEKLQALLSSRPPVLTHKEQQTSYEQAQTQKSTQFVKEISQQGKVKWAVYWKYLEAASKAGVFGYIFAIFAQQGFTVREYFSTCRSSKD